ncbi:MAG: hypothetical protein KAT48_05275 [Bacteroidales bacterium]|nr:hypothetical protein [Bacteroidales bacterium]
MKIKKLKHVMLLACGLILLSNTLPDKSVKTNYNNTKVIAHLNEKIPQNANIIYSASFEAAWKVLKKEVIGGNVLLKDPIPLCAHLNRSCEDVIITDDILAMSGTVGTGIIKNINKALKKKFGFTQPELNKHSERDDNIICYSYFDKHIQFNEPFELLNRPLNYYINGKKYELSAFGVIKYSESNEIHNKISEQVDIIDYRDCNDFILRLKGKNNNEGIIVAKVPPLGSLKETIEKVESRIDKSTPEKLQQGASMAIPKVKFSVDKSYDILLGKHLANKGFEDYFFAVAQQDIKFSLDETGATAQSEAVMVIKKGNNDGLFIFDRPFLIYMKEKSSSKPYLAMWIADPEILETVN